MAWCYCHVIFYITGYRVLGRGWAYSEVPSVMFMSNSSLGCWSQGHTWALFWNDSGVLAARWKTVLRSCLYVCVFLKCILKSELTSSNKAGPGWYQKQAFKSSREVRPYKATPSWISHNQEDAPIGPSKPGGSTYRSFPSLLSATAGLMVFCQSFPLVCRS